MNDWVELQVKTRQYGNASDYVRNQQDQGQILILQRAICKGVESGISDRSMLEILKEAQKKVHKPE